MDGRSSGSKLIELTPANCKSVAAVSDQLFALVADPKFAVVISVVVVSVVVVSVVVVSAVMVVSVALVAASAVLTREDLD